MRADAADAVISHTAVKLGGRFWQCLIWSQTNKSSQLTRTSVEAANAVASDSSSRTRRETARPRKGAGELGGPGADRGPRRASASRVRRPAESQVRVSGAACPAPKATRTGRLLPYHPADEDNITYGAPPPVRR